MILTKEQELLLDCWVQFALTKYKNPHANIGDKIPVQLGNGGLSTLEDVQSYLEERKLIDRKGLVDPFLFPAPWCARQHRWVDLIIELPDGCPFSGLKWDGYCRRGECPYHKWKQVSRYLVRERRKGRTHEDKEEGNKR